MNAFEDNTLRTLAPLADRRGEIILSAAYEIFAEKGMAGARIADFVSRAHLSPEALAVRYGDKDGVFCAVLDWAARRFGLGQLTFGFREPSTALERVALTAGRALSAPEVVVLRRLIVSEGWKSPRIVAAYDAAFVAPIRAALTRIMDVATTRGAEIDDRAEFESLFMGWLAAESSHALTSQTIIEDRTISRRAKALARRIMRAYAPIPRPTAQSAPEPATGPTAELSLEPSIEPAKEPA
jgi:AcrR family transcriptional regulator